MESRYSNHVDPLSPNNTHGIALQLVGKSKKVLELGAASGHVTQALKSLDNTVTAVERDGRFKEKLLAVADNVLITDLDWLDLSKSLKGNNYDVILLGNVLEHCIQPDLVLFQLHDLLNDDGYIVISLPNIAHGDVRLALLEGNFDYRDSGLLDRTHIRFFTRETIESFLFQNGFEQTEIFGVTAPIGTTEIGLPSPSVPAEAITFVQQQRDATVYQFVVKASKRPEYLSAVHQVKEQDFGSHSIEQLLGELSLYQDFVSRIQNPHSENQKTIQQELTQTLEINEALLHQVNELKHQVLISTDHAIGQSAELGELRYRLDISEKEIDSLNYQLDLIKQSRTWRIGSIFLLPLRLLQKCARFFKS